MKKVESKSLAFTQEQLAERRQYITATNVPVIMGVSPWMSAVDLWMEKTGRTAEKELHPTLAEKGFFLEPAIRSWFTHKTGIQIDIDEELHKHKIHSFMAAHTDGITPCKTAVFEAKTAMNASKWGEQGENIIPDHYLLQVAHEVACADAERAYIAVLIGGHELRHYYYERNEKLEKLIERRCREFWNCIQTDEPPPIQTGHDVISLHGTDIDDEIKVTDAELEAEIQELRELKETIKEYEERQKQIESKIKVYMCKTAFLLDRQSNIVATWKPCKDSIRFNEEEFKKENAELYAKYKTKVVRGTRRFLIK